MPQASWRGVRAGHDPCLMHDPFDELPGAAAREPPEFRAAVFKVVHLMDHVEEFGGHRNLAEYNVALTFLERPERDESGVPLDQSRRQSQRLGYPAAGIGERQA